MSTVQCSHLLVKHQGSRRPASWRDPNGAQITKRTKEQAIEILKGYRQVHFSSASDLRAPIPPLCGILFSENINLFYLYSQFNFSKLLRTDLPTSPLTSPSSPRKSRTVARLLRAATSENLVRARCRRHSRQCPSSSKWASLATWSRPILVSTSFFALSNSSRY